MNTGIHFLDHHWTYEKSWRGLGGRLPPSFLPCFIACFLAFLPSVLRPSFLPCFPSFLPSLFPSFLPSLLACFLPSFLPCCLQELEKILKTTPEVEKNPKKGRKHPKKILPPFKMSHGTTGPEDQRTSGPEDQRTKGPEDQRTRGPGDQRTRGPETRGPEDQGTRGPEDQRTRGPEDQRTRGPEDQRTRGPEDQRTRGPEDQRTRGPEDQRTRGPEDQGTRAPDDQRTRGPEDQGTRGLEEQRTRGHCFPSFLCYGLIFFDAWKFFFDPGIICFWSGNIFFLTPIPSQTLVLHRLAIVIWRVTTFWSKSPKSQPSNTPSLKKPWIPRLRRRIKASNKARVNSQGEKCGTFWIS